MSTFRQGKWQISSVHVNSESVRNEEFAFFEIDGDDLIIQPAGHRMTVREHLDNHAVLESEDEQIYQAEFICEGDDMQIKMSMPGVEETVLIKGMSCQSKVCA